MGAAQKCQAKKFCFYSEKRQNWNWMLVGCLKTKCFATWRRDALSFEGVMCVSCLGQTQENSLNLYAASCHNLLVIQGCQAFGVGTGSDLFRSWLWFSLKSFSEIVPVFWLVKKFEFLSCRPRRFRNFCLRLHSNLVIRHLVKRTTRKRNKYMLQNFLFV